MKEDTQEWLKSECNRYTNGSCSTLKCLLRGGYQRGKTKPNYDLATCHAYELLQEFAKRKEPAHET